MSPTPDSTAPTQEAKEAVTAERRRIAKLIHDDLAQELMAAGLLASVLARELSKEGHPQAQEANALSTSLATAVTNMRTIYEDVATAEAPLP